jgi:hypothetical protein
MTDLASALTLGGWGDCGRMGRAIDKKKLPIDKLLQWAYLDELPKRILNSQGEAWDRLSRYGSLGGIDIDETVSMPQRYAYVGEPHRDALAIEHAVNSLGSSTLDWKGDFELIAWDLAALVRINELEAPQRRRFIDGSSGWTDGQIEKTKLVQHRLGAGARVIADDARDVLMVATTNVTALVHMHAINRTVPFFNDEQPRPSMIPADRGRGAKLVGECKAKNLYETGSFCPLSWWPSPLQVVLDRAEYLLWYRALTRLHDELDLEEHQAQKPEENPAPWIKAPIPRRTHRQVATFKRKSEYDVQRPRAGLPPKKPRNSKVRNIPID